MKKSIAILDFGSQYTQLIARRVREMQVYCEIFPWDTPAETVLHLNPGGFILSGGPSSVYAAQAPTLKPYLLESGLPLLGICYGMQVLAQALGGSVAASTMREYGLVEINPCRENTLLPMQSQTVWMSHGDRVEVLPPGFELLARSTGAPIAAMADEHRKYYGVQFHPEVHHTPRGTEILNNFVLTICEVKADWSPDNIITEAISRIKEQVGKQHAIAAVSGGVDSSVATVLVHRAIGDRLCAVFVDTGLLRMDEADQVETALKQNLGIHLTRVNAAERFMRVLAGVIEPEVKRRIIGAEFIHVFEETASKIGALPYLVQGTIYPDVVESSAPDRSKVEKIKSHHNVGGLPEKMNFKLVEPLRYLFKDEIRKVGEVLGIPPELVWRQPFPGPGLAVRCLGEVTPARVSTLQQVDTIFIQELETEGLINRKPVPGQPSLAQAFAVLLPVRSVGVMGDQRTYQEVVALRAVTSEDFMTADWAQLPGSFLVRVSNRIVNEVQGVNRVVYDITSKPPATIEWE